MNTLTQEDSEGHMVQEVLGRMYQEEVGSQNKNSRCGMDTNH